ncbi:MAG TPA: M24 family metallopeptidase [Thermoanaerobaculia bacterium]
MSGKFTQAQSETLDFLNRAYLAGVGAMRPGSKTEDVYAAMNRYILDHRTELRGGTAREAFAGVDERSQWFLHGLGLDLIETAPAVFRAGNVLCFEPRVTVGAESFFVEDTFLITPDGHRTLSPALPYLAAAIVRELATRTGGAGRRTASPPRARTRTR